MVRKEANQTLGAHSSGASETRTDMRHGCRILCAGSLLFTTAIGSEPPVHVAGETFDVHYQVNEAALPLDTVALWFTTDGGTTWVEYGSDADDLSPITFRATREGLHGFYFVLTNAGGPSSTPPQTGVTPQLTVFVDYTRPAVQLHPVRQTNAQGHRTVQIRWAAIDINFDDRPVQLEYRRTSASGWDPLSAEPLANTGRYDWRIPDDIHGPVAIRMVVTDRAGHQVTTEAQTFELAPVPATQPATARLTGAPGVMRGGLGINGVGIAPLQVDDRSQRLMAQAASYRERGQLREAIARLREAVRLNPRWAKAFVEMGEMLYHIGDLDRALNAYELALRQQPTMRRGLRGAAMVHRRQNDHNAAGRLLRTILQTNPNDAEVWINLGDISVFQGDEVMARECYTRATLVDPSASQVIANARKRLELMSTVSRTYSPNGR